MRNLTTNIPRADLFNRAGPISDNEIVRTVRVDPSIDRSKKKVLSVPIPSSKAGYNQSRNVESLFVPNAMSIAAEVADTARALLNNSSTSYKPFDSRPMKNGKRLVPRRTLFLHIESEPTFAAAARRDTCRRTWLQVSAPHFCWRVFHSVHASLMPVLLVCRHVCFYA